MSMGRSKTQQQEIWVATGDLQRGPGHPFYERLNEILGQHGFDAFVEGLCARFYAETMGRPSLAPGVYFRLLLLGFFEGIDSERGIAWRLADSLSVRDFVGMRLNEQATNHSTISRTRRLIDRETHAEVFTWVLKVLAKEDLLKGKTIGIDATTLEANAALRSIVHRDTGESYREFLEGLAKASGIETPTREDLAKFDKKRKKRKTSNAEWEHPHDPDSKITKMKDGRTHLAHKAEHAVDMETGAIVAVTLQGADRGDTQTIETTEDELREVFDELVEDPEVAEKLSDDPLAERVTDKGYHSNAVLKGYDEVGIRTYISEPDRGRRNWSGKSEEQAATYGNRRRTRGVRGKHLLRSRGELLERSFAHCYDTGGMRRTHLRGHENILKRLLIHHAGFNLGLVMRKLYSVGKPRRLQGVAWVPGGLFRFVCWLDLRLWCLQSRIWSLLGLRLLIPRWAGQSRYA